jgi:hypothetical protein
MRPGGPQNPPGRCIEDKKSLALAVIENGPAAYSLSLFQMIHLGFIRSIEEKKKVDQRKS